MKKIIATLLSVAMALTLIPSSSLEKVQASDTIINDLNLIYDIDALEFHTLNTEANVRNHVIETITSDTVGVNVHNNSNSGLCYWSTSYNRWDSTIYSTDKIKSDTEYAIMFGVQENENYSFPSSVKAYDLENLGNLTDITDISVKVNGAALNDAFFFYSESWNMLCVYVPIGKPKVVTPIVNDVTIDSTLTSVKKGGYYVFNANVTGEYIDANKDVTWSVSGNEKLGTFIISQSGELYLDDEETATSLTITATSVYDNTKSGSYVVSVSDEPLIIESITISPEETTVRQGTYFSFDYDISGDYPDLGVKWTVIGAKSSDTYIDVYEGLLYVAKDETADQLTIRVSSTADKTKYAEAVVTVEEAIFLESLDLTYDFDELDFFIGNSEDNVQNNAREIISTKTTGTEVFHNSNSGLNYWNTNNWAPVGEYTTNSINADKEYAIMFGIEATGNYEYPESIKSYTLYNQGNLSDISDFSVKVNGTPLNDAIIFYSESWHSLCVYVPIGKAKLNIGDADITGIEDKDYTGSAITQNPIVKIDDTTLVEGTDYKVEYKDNIESGTASVIIKGMGKYTSKKIVTFTIKSIEVPDKNLISISDAIITGIQDKTYNGNAHTQKAIVKLNDKTLVADIDYTISYDKNINAGTATMTITGKGSYTGNKSINFKIKKAKCKLKYKLKNKTYNAKAKKKTSFKAKKLFKIQYNPSKGKLEYKIVSGNKKITISKTGKITVKKGLQKVKTYKVTVKARIKVTKNYNASKWVKKTITFKVK